MMFSHLQDGALMIFKQYIYETVNEDMVVSPCYFFENESVLHDEISIGKEL